MYDVAIIGAGVSGAAIARRLSSYRISVALIERCVDASFGVSKANSGIIHAGFHHAPASLKARLEVAGNRAFDALQAELGFPFRRNGIVVAAFSWEEMKVVDGLYAQGLANGARGIEIVGRDRLLALEPALSRDVAGGLFAPEGGIIEPYRFVFALVESAVANGARLLTGWEVSKAQRMGNAWRLTSAEGEALEARWVVNAAGLHADTVSAIFGGEHFSITPRKGEEFILEKGAAGPPSRVIFPVPARTSKGVLVIPTVEGTVMLGPTAEEGQDKEDTSTTPENLDRVFDLATRMVPRISKRDIITAFSGLRPTLPGDDFYIDISREAPAFVQVAGIQSPGLTASPAIAERVRDLLREAGLELQEKQDWHPGIAHVERTRDRTISDLDQLVAKDLAYAHIVCRCEAVSEAEVVEAIRKGHTTLDGIKYYTRAGMGRCQGGFCTYRIMRLISRETGLPLEQISKHGPGSELVVSRIGAAESGGAS
ncbi:MAG: NAD(P)/FAD-dependent oxidoreductase [Spirochaetia bacterium]